MESQFVRVVVRVDMNGVLVAPSPPLLRSRRDDGGLPVGTLAAMLGDPCR